MNISFEMNHKYIATILEDRLKSHLPGTAASTLKVELEQSIELLGTKLVAHWKELRRPIYVDSYKCHFYEPTTLWQRFKRDHFPKRFIDKFPIKNKRHTQIVHFTRYAEYPMADIPLPQGHGFGSVVIQDVVNSEVVLDGHM